MGVRVVTVRLWQIADNSPQVECRPREIERAAPFLRALSRATCLALPVPLGMQPPKLGLGTLVLDEAIASAQVAVPRHDNAPVRFEVTLMVPGRGIRVWSWGP